MVFYTRSRWAEHLEQQQSKAWTSACMCQPLAEQVQSKDNIYVIAWDSTNRLPGKTYGCKFGNENRGKRAKQPQKPKHERQLQAHANSAAKRVYNACNPTFNLREKGFVWRQMSLGTTQCIDQQGLPSLWAVSTIKPEQGMSSICDTSVLYYSAVNLSETGLCYMVDSLTTFFVRIVIMCTVPK